MTRGQKNDPLPIIIVVVAEQGGAVRASAMPLLPIIVDNVVAIIVIM
jgi:hypothetical protein